MLEESPLSGGGKFRAGTFTSGAVWVLLMLEAAVILRAQVWDCLVPGDELLCQGPPLLLGVKIHLHPFWVRTERTNRAISAITSCRQQKLQNSF